MRIFNSVLLLAALTSSQLFAANLTVAPPPRPTPPQIAPRAVSPAMPATRSNITVFNYADFDPSCTAWGDGCRRCYSRAIGGRNQINCSNIGIACQPLDNIRCSRRQTQTVIQGDDMRTLSVSVLVRYAMRLERSNNNEKAFATSSHLSPDSFSFCSRRECGRAIFRSASTR